VTPAELVGALEARGLRFQVRAGNLVASPAGVLTDAERAALSQAKPAVLALLRERQARLLDDVAKVKLRDLTRVLEVAVDWCDVPLLIAPGCKVAQALRAADPKPGRIWCVCEVLDLLLTSVPREDAQKIGQAKVALSGTITGARRLNPGEARP
jgi:hypothetical protein